MTKKVYTTPETDGLCALVDVAIPLFQRYAIRNFIQADSLRGIVPFSLAYLLVIVLQALSVVAFARNSMTIEMNMGRDMRRSLFHHLQTLSFSFYNVTPVGYLLTRVMSDTNRIASMIAWNMTDILWALFYVLGTFAAMLALNWRLALVVIVIVPVMAVLTGYFQNRILRWNRKVRKLNSRIRADNQIHRILLTASGGPFRGKKRADLEQMTLEDALKHPNWSMGKKVTIDSASLVNKGLEVMEAKWLFDVSLDQIQVVVHPQSIVHSAVEYDDG